MAEAKGNEQVGCLILALLIAGGIFIYNKNRDSGPRRNAKPATQVTLSEEQNALRNVQGAPPYFSLIQAVDHGAPARVETWSYPEIGTHFVFVNGRYAYAKPIVNGPASRSAGILPEQFPLNATRAQVHARSGKPRASFEIPSKLVKDAVFDFYNNGLVVAFQEQILVAAITVPVDARAMLWPDTIPPPTAAIAIAILSLIVMLAAIRAWRRYEPIARSRQITQRGVVQFALIGATVLTVTVLQVILHSVNSGVADARDEELRQVMAEQMQQLDQLIRTKPVGSEKNDLIRMRSQWKEAHEKLEAVLTKELKKETNKIVREVGLTYGIKAAEFGLSSMIKNSHVFFTLAAGGLEAALMLASAEPDTLMDEFIVSGLVPGLANVSAGDRKSLALKLLEIQIRSQCRGAAQPKTCAGTVASRLLARLDEAHLKIPDSVRTGIRSAWCEAAGQYRRDLTNTGWNAQYVAPNGAPVGLGRIQFGDGKQGSAVRILVPGVAGEGPVWMSGSYCGTRLSVRSQDPNSVFSGIEAEIDEVRWEMQGRIFFASTRGFGSQYLQGLAFYARPN